MIETLSRTDAELTIDFPRTARAMFSSGSVHDTLAHLLTLAVATIGGCDSAGILLVDGDAVTPFDSDPLVGLDTLPQRTGEGPCLDAISQNETFYADDLAADNRWPRFGPEAIARGIRSRLALPLLANGTLGALNLYAQVTQAFGVVDRANGAFLAGLAGLALTSAQGHEDDERRAANLHAGLATRELIGQAQGILIERQRISADQAFDVLRRSSQHRNVKLPDVAQTLVDTGEDPDCGTRGPAPGPGRQNALTTVPRSGTRMSHGESMRRVLACSALIGRP
jgi:GAF domain-containing protein